MELQPPRFNIYFALVTYVLNDMILSQVLLERHTVQEFVISIILHMGYVIYTLTVLMQILGKSFHFYAFVVVLFWDFGSGVWRLDLSSVFSGLLAVNAFQIWWLCEKYFSQIPERRNIRRDIRELVVDERMAYLKEFYHSHQVPFRLT